jgi:hypothetical protein
LDAGRRRNLLFRHARCSKFLINIQRRITISGLFHYRQGAKRNIPIVRVGNLAAFAEEKISTELGLIDAHLIEARSIGGLSGSPVFLHLGVVRSVDNKVRTSVSGPVLYLLGLVHGHFKDVSSTGIDQISRNTDGTSLNTGIAMVVPVEKIIETLEAN